MTEVAKRLRFTSEAKELLSNKTNVTVGGTRDVRLQAGQAAKGAILPASELLVIRQTLISGRRLQRLISRQHHQFPLLASIIEQIEPCDALIDAIGQAIDENGQVSDSASPNLRRLRREFEQAHQKLLDRMQRIVQNAENVRYLQEPIVTQRSGRYVIPVKVESKAHMPGFVHDQSSSGATVFIEPLATLDLNNRWRELEIAVQREIERILRALSELVGEAHEDISSTVQALAQLDLQLAKAEYAFQIKGREPILTNMNDRESTQPYVHLIQARHPLLKPSEVVPTDINLGPDYHILVITGPNTGGKTVTLKNVGLMALMAQCGLHIPANDGSRLPVFDNIFADIGDEQSIEQSLSTFSSHLTNIKRMLATATERSLILLDEVGAGTDPVEGSALARSLLEHFVEQHISALVATHYSDLKSYAHSIKHIRNASVEFDLETLRPTYNLIIGLPGRSNALNIAERLGMPTEIIERARSFLSSDELEVDELLEEIKLAHDSAKIDRRLAEKDRKESETLRDQLREQIASIEEDRREVINLTRQEAQAELQQIKEELRILTRKIRRFGGKKQELGEIKDVIKQLDSQLKPISKLAPRRPSGVDDMIEAEIKRPLRVGDLVWVSSFDRTGEVLTVSNNEAEVQTGNFRLRVAIADLKLRTPTSHQQQLKPKKRPQVDITLPKVERPNLEIDLRGKSIEEMHPLLEKYIDNAYLSGMPFVHIIHGKGTGVLRRAVREELRHHTLIKSHRSGALNQGGDGMTVATLVES